MGGSQERLIIQTVRIAQYGVLVLLILLNHILQPGFYNWPLLKSFYSIAALGLAIHGAPLFFLNSFFQSRKLLAFSFVIDAILISYLLWSTGLNQSLFLFLYLVTIILSALVFRMRGALLIAGLCSIGFTLASLLGPEIKAMSFLFIIILNNLAFFGVALLGGYLSEQLNLFATRLEVSNLNLAIIRRLNELIVETIPFGLLSVNEVGEILNFNPAVQDILGLNEDITGKSLFAAMKELKKFVRDLSAIGDGVKLEIQYDRWGESLLLGVQVLPQNIERMGEQTYLVILEDLTQVRTLESALRQNEKLAAIGQLAAGIAHEIRNPLAGISGSIELLSQNFNTEEDKKLTKIILREIDRLNNLISEFLDYSKPEKMPSDRVNLSAVLKECVEVSKTAVPHEVQIHINIPPEATILGSRDKLKQAILNIVINAHQAMSSTSKRELTGQIKRLESGWELRIKDTGVGMKPETKKRLFEPFHTTKPKGTGLGLAVSYKILQSHKAKVTVESEEGKGTEFIIEFPALT